MDFCSAYVSFEIICILLGFFSIIVYNGNFSCPSEKDFFFLLFDWAGVLRKRKWMAVNSSVVLCQSQKIFSRWPERENSKIYFRPLAVRVTRSSLPNSYLLGGFFVCFFVLFCFFGSQGKNAKNVIKSSSVLCHTAWTVGQLGHWPSSCSTQLFSAVTGPESNQALPVPFFVPTMFVHQARLVLACASCWAPCKEQPFQEGSPCSFVIFKASVEAWAFSKWTGKDLAWASEYLGSGTGVTCPIIMHWQILSPFLTLNFSHVNTGCAFESDIGICQSDYHIIDASYKTCLRNLQCDNQFVWFLVIPEQIL